MSKSKGPGRPAHRGACSTWKPKENAQESQSRNKVLKVNSRKWSCWLRGGGVQKSSPPRFKNPAHDLKIPSHDRRFNYLINTALRRAVAHHNLNMHYKRGALALTRRRALKKERDELGHQTSSYINTREREIGRCLGRKGPATG